MAVHYFQHLMSVPMPLRRPLSLMCAGLTNGGR